MRKRRIMRTMYVKRRDEEDGEEGRDLETERSENELFEEEGWCATVNGRGRHRLLIPMEKTSRHSAISRRRSGGETMRSVIGNSTFLWAFKCGFGTFLYYAESTDECWQPDKEKS
ncbi:hypothetical protein K402DRAFT_106006 [Aulographum hederae CBS 113979]|uniref:Uncharacterized protein n=1 Tax=Aulographum hederae CBS 113979 TaxID=1176131 RepID=A0A6G1GXJ4_9PEZI|nr:hypothetical protein K402DRAFT_106006 [Aulographum hederae CBS 113979]